MGFNKYAKKLLHTYNSPMPMEYPVQEMHPKQLGIYDKAEGVNNRLLAYTNNMPQGMVGGAMIGAGLRAFTGKGSIGLGADVHKSVKDNTPLYWWEKIKQYKDAILKPAVTAEGILQRKVITKNVGKGLLIGGAAGLGATALHNAANYELAHATAAKRELKK